MPDEFPSNSHKSKAKEQPAEPKVEQVVTGRVITQKQGLSRRIFETFKGEDMRSVGNGVLFEVLIPAFKTMLADAGKDAIERALFGGEVRTVRSRSTGQTVYSSMFKPKPKSGSELSYKAKAQHDFNEIILETKVEADEVIDRIADLIENFGQATVGDFYDLVGVTKSFTDEKWGWTDIRGAKTIRVNEGWLVKLPKTEPID